MKWLLGKNIKMSPLIFVPHSVFIPQTNISLIHNPFSDVAGHATVTLTEHFIPAQPGPRKLVASLDCKQLTQVHGVADITVLE